MSRKSVIKVSDICDLFINDSKLLKKGENAVESGHVTSFVFDAESLFLKGSVLASMKDKSYSVQVLLKENYSIHSSRCECPRGLVLCHHVAALLIHAHYNVSITDKQCVWSQKKGSDKDGVKSVNELFPSKKFEAIKTVPSEVRSKTFELLQACGTTVGFTWLLSPEASETSHHLLPSPRDIIFSKEFEMSQEKQQLFCSAMALSSEQIAKTVQESKGQTSNWLWSILRSDRLASSNFGAVLSAYRRNSFPPSLHKKLLNTYNLDGVKAVQWGREHENDGAKCFQDTMKLKTEETGLWLHESGFLGASPDRIVTFPDGSIGTVEIKFPFRFKTELLSEVLTKYKKYVVFKENDAYKFNFNHDIYHQVQGQIHLANCQKGFLVLWTLKESLIFEVARDEAWASNISILKSFYLTYFLPHISKNP